MRQSLDRVIHLAGVTFDHRAARDGAAPPHHRLADEASHDHDNVEETLIPDRYAILDDRDVRRVMHFRAPV